MTKKPPRTGVKTRKSPLKAAPLRNPGQSVDEEIERLNEDRVMPYAMGLSMAIALALYEWVRWYLNTPPQPWVVTGVALVAVLFFVWKLKGCLHRYRQLRLARDGERAVGQYLERLREHGYQVLHDLIGDNFNVDHVLLGPAGIFTVETKTVSKPQRGKAEVRYDGQSLTVDGFTPDRDPIIQGKAQAGWLRELLEESTGKRFPVRALVVYPGWFVTTTTKPFGLDVLVLNPRGLPGLLEKLPRTLPDEDIKLASYHLSRYARAKRG